MPPRLRSALSAVLVALSCFLTPFGALAAWAAYGLTDSGRYVTTMAPLAADPAVRDAIADTVGAGILREVQVGGVRVGGVRMSGVQISATRGVMAPFVHDAMRSFTKTEAFRVAWDEGNRVTHDAVLHALQDEGRTGTVTVDLAPVTASVKHQLARENPPLANSIPVRHTEVAVLPAGELGPLRKEFHVLEVAGFWLPVAAAVFAVTGIAVAVRRRRAITATALGTALGGALLGLALAIGRHFTVADLPAEISGAAGGAIYDALTSTLRTVAWLLLGVGLTVAALAWLTRYARPVREFLLLRLLRDRRASATPVADRAQQPSRAQV
ncbi:hypothetical protein [Streptomyces sp. NBC_00989]|uniref:hypothetical protein n=1 Tax=Streptomyces sp. NBC_00989 TaxID=2903705 RepID=UPI0038676788|nr:hypothetical protein OG714_24955 [Streptomyces sp. NBC_00989]